MKKQKNVEIHHLTFAEGGKRNTNNMSTNVDLDDLENFD